MGIAQDIGQPEFRNERQKAAINIIYTYNWLMERMSARLSEFDLTSQQFNILRILRGAKGPLSTMQIRGRMLDKMSDTSRIVDRLILKDLVKKNLCSRDKRLVDVMITEKGLALLGELDKYAPEMDAIVGNLAEEETCQLNLLLDKIREECKQHQPDGIEKNS